MIVGKSHNILYVCIYIEIANVKFNVLLYILYMHKHTGTGATFVGDVYGHSDRVSVKNFTSCTRPSSITEFNSKCGFAPAVNTTECTEQEMTGNVICAGM